ncbi:hypothetical protein G7Y89_g14910 [Cudoniella acicularis]|uniref:Uncharacterized protein n=1 Tax=Cudoniella acicularis TaxID=354080 RepID=A0A8H4QX11_9HELO|nr:hypothetical protein G7Y89_g14910 [Cudoniella acicularis]
MKSFISSIFAIAAILSVATAAPTPETVCGSARDIKLIGEGASDFYVINVPLNKKTSTGKFSLKLIRGIVTNSAVTATAPNHTLKVSRVIIPSDLKCTFIGIDEEKPHADPEVGADGQLGPPQIIESIFCTCK